jgi:biopolymer transport protein TolR
MAFSGGGPNSAEINITPLIDILLVLIIVFMVVVSMSQQKGEKAEIPQPAQDKSLPSPERTIVIQLEMAGHEPPSLKINEQVVSWESLEPRLHEIFTPRVEKVAFVKGDKDTPFEYIADVIDMTHQAGVDHVGLLTPELQQQARLRNEPTPRELR